MPVAAVTVASLVMLILPPSFANAAIPASAVKVPLVDAAVTVIDESASVVIETSPVPKVKPWMPKPAAALIVASLVAMVTLPATSAFTVPLLSGL